MTTVVALRKYSCLQIRIETHVIAIIYISKFLFFYFFLFISFFVLVYCRSMFVHKNLYIHLLLTDLLPLLDIFSLEQTSSRGCESVNSKWIGTY